jgi:hypothetical protein
MFFHHVLQNASNRFKHASIPLQFRFNLLQSASIRSSS